MPRYPYFKARRLADYQGRRTYRVPVTIHVPYLRPLDALLAIGRDGEELHTEIVAHSAAEAANHCKALVLDAMGPEAQPFDLVAFGPRGGEVTRYAGWESCIVHGMWGAARPLYRQMTLNLEA